MAFVNVEGVVSRLHNSGNGFGVKETWTTKDGERARYWAVFPKEAVQVREGDRVKVSGGLQTSVTDPKTDSQGNERRYVDHLVGSAKVEVAPQQAQAVPQQPNNSPWGGSPTESNFGNDRPF